MWCPLLPGIELSYFTMRLLMWGDGMIARVFALIALLVVAATDASAQGVGNQFGVPDLSGVYRCVRQCARAGLVRIAQRGWELYITDELGRPARGWIKPSYIWIESWRELAVYSPSAFTIQFQRGTVWVLL